jgi:hypothetical protein
MSVAAKASVAWSTVIAVTNSSVSPPPGHRGHLANS